MRKAVLEGVREQKIGHIMIDERDFMRNGTSEYQVLTLQCSKAARGEIPHVQQLQHDRQAIGQGQLQLHNSSLTESKQGPTGSGLASPLKGLGGRFTSLELTISYNGIEFEQLHVMLKVLSDYDAQIQEIRSLKERALEEERSRELGARRPGDKSTSSAAQSRVENVREDEQLRGFVEFNIGGQLWRQIVRFF
jgi:hypothetical protein